MDAPLPMGMNGGGPHPQPPPPGAMRGGGGMPMGPPSGEFPGGNPGDFGAGGGGGPGGGNGEMPPNNSSPSVNEDEFSGIKKDYFLRLGFRYLTTKTL